MNVEAPDLKTLGAEALRDLLNNLTQAKGFLLDQAPDFCQQLVARGMVLPLAGFIVAALVAAVAIRIAVWCSKDGIRITEEGGAEYRANIEQNRAFQSALGIFVGILATGAALITGFTALSVYIAPKVFLVEEITRMLK